MTLKQKVDISKCDQSIVKKKKTVEEVVAEVKRRFFETDQLFWVSLFQNCRNQSG